MTTNWRKLYLLTLLLIITTFTLYTFLNHEFTHLINYKQLFSGNLVNTFIEKLKQRWRIKSEPDIIRTNIPSDIKLSDVTCVKLNSSTHLNNVETWQPLDKHKLAFVFSAYFVEESKKIVIIGIKMEYNSLPFCQFWWYNSNMEENKPFLLQETQAKLIQLPEGHKARYSVVLIECSLNLTSVPTHVSVVEKNCSTPLNFLSVHHVIKPDANIRKFTVCLSPLFQFSGAYQLVEWIELNKILGAERFTVYNYSSDSKVQRVLDYYSKQDLANVIQWRLPTVEVSTSAKRKVIGIHYHGQVAALNDCLYRNKYTSEFIVNIDLDEFIIPHTENVTTWSDMLYQLKREVPAYIFRNIIFRKEWNNTDIDIPNKTLVDKYQLITLQKVLHEKKIYKSGDRSKYFARTSRVSSVMIHKADEKNALSVPTSIALLHHYRTWRSKDNSTHKKVIDTTVPIKFGEDLIKNVRRVLSDLNII